VTLIPRYLLEKIALGGGQRLPGMRFLGEESPVETKESLTVLAAKAIRSNVTTVTGYRPSKATSKKGPYSTLTMMVLEHPVLEFRHYEYRFWMVPINRESGKIDKAICRVCQCVFITPEGRKRHKKEIGCYNKLARAEKLMTEQRCVICMNRTVNSHWGMYMCGTDCEQKFLHEIDQPEALFSALERLEIGESNGV
jgi:hypothetical protein